MVFVAFVVAGVGMLLWQRRQDHAMADGSSATTMKDIVADAGIGVAAKSLDADLYTLRNVAPNRPMLHLSLRSDVVHAVASLHRYLRRDRGKMWRLLVCLEDFFARFDGAIVAPPARAARAVRILLDTRAEAMNVMHTLVFARPNALSEKLLDAIGVVRRVTQNCMSALGNKHGRDASVRAADWRPPYAFDPRKDPNYNVF